MKSVRSDTTAEGQRVAREAAPYGPDGNEVAHRDTCLIARKHTEKGESMEGTREYRKARRTLKGLGYWPGMAGAGAEEAEDKQAAYRAEIERAVAQLEPEALVALAALATALAEHSG